MDWDIKELLDNLKEDGLDIAEDGLKKLVEKGIEWANVNAAKSDKPLVQLVPVALNAIKPFIIDMIDKIDGEEG